MKKLLYVCGFLCTACAGPAFADCDEYCLAVSRVEAARIIAHRCAAAHYNAARGDQILAEAITHFSAIYGARGPADNYVTAGEAYVKGVITGTDNLMKNRLREDKLLFCAKMREGASRMLDLLTFDIR